jgi:ABC-type molybdate transport system substrate-binding protein
MPDELQNYTVFVAGTPENAKAPDAATAFVRFLSGPVAAGAIKAKGMQTN